MSESIDELSSIVNTVSEELKKVSTLNDKGEQCCLTCGETDTRKMHMPYHENGVLWFCETCGTEHLVISIEDLPADLQEKCRESK